MNPNASQFPTSNVKVHASLLTPGNPDTYERSNLRGALRSKSKLNAFGSDEKAGYKNKYGMEPSDAYNTIDDEKNGRYYISDNPDTTPTTWKP